MHTLGQSSVSVITASVSDNSMSESLFNLNHCLNILRISPNGNVNPLLSLKNRKISSRQNCLRQTHRHHCKALQENDATSTSRNC